MKQILLIFIILISSSFINSQTISSHVEVTKVFSQNEKYYLHTIPYDNYEPSLKGKTLVYKVGGKDPIYTLNRGFDSIRNELILSNNGEIIVSIHSFFAREKVEGLKSISIYKNGNLIRDFTKSEITKCNLEKERCELVYRDYELFEKRISNSNTIGGGGYERVIRKGATEQDIFLYNYEIFNHDDTLYITDSKKRTHQFDLKEGKYSGFEPFEKIYPNLKFIARKNKVESKSYEVPYNYDFPNLQNGKDIKKALADFLEMKVVDYDDEQFKVYRIKISGTVFQNGSVQIDKVDSDMELLSEKVRKFFETNKFDTKSMPKVFDQFYIDDKSFYFRKSDDKIARQEKKEQEKEIRKAIKKLMVAEKINNIYIPKDLGDAFAKLDEELKEIDKSEMKALPNKDDMYKYHMGLGMWMRNNWGLWGGSRLQKYFLDRGVTHPDDMSSTVLLFYYDWLNGNKEAWKVWDKNALSKTQKK